MFIHLAIVASQCVKSRKILRKFEQGHPMLSTLAPANWKRIMQLPISHK